MRAKIHGEGVLAICEKDLVGKCFEEGKLQLKPEKEFYGEKEISEEELEGFMKKAHIINMVGWKPIRIAIKLGYAVEDDVIKIKGVPHVQIIKV